MGDSFPLFTLINPVKMAKQKTPFHQLLIDNGLTTEVTTIVLTALDAELKTLNESIAAEIAKMKADHEIVIAKLNADHEIAIKEATELNGILTGEKSELEQKVAELSSKMEQTERITIGTYKAKNKKTYKFQNGILEFVFARSGSAAAEKILTKEALKDAALMEELISIGAGFIEEVES